jgi:hypothetical protein
VRAFTGAASLLLHELWIPKEAPGVLLRYPTEVAAKSMRFCRMMIVSGG